MTFLYLIALIVSIICMILTDWRYKLAFFYNKKSTVLTLSIGMLVFILWDIIGITFGIFFSGQSPYMSGLYLAPEFPIEELFFLFFLCYFTLITYRLLETRWRPTSS